MEQKISPEQFNQTEQKKKIKEQFLIEGDAKDAEDINALLQQISDKKYTSEQLNELLRQPDFSLLTLRDNSKEDSPIIAMASIHFKNTLSGLKGYIEDISVLEGYKKESQELEERMRKKFIELATQRGARIEA